MTTKKAKSAARRIRTRSRIVGVKYDDQGRVASLRPITDWRRSPESDIPLDKPTKREAS